MVLLSGEHWSGNLLLEKTAKATGQINGYSWLFTSKAQSFLVEIAEDKRIEGADLPLVGFGCSGWLYESEQTTFPSDEDALIQYIENTLSAVFTLFRENKLNYLPAVSCPCSE